jgi:hypothetical protein
MYRSPRDPELGRDLLLADEAARFDLHVDYVISDYAESIFAVRFESILGSNDHLDSSLLKKSIENLT